MSANWDVFHGERLETERGLTSDQIRAGLANGSIKEDDLIRPAGSTFGWTPILDVAEFQPPAAPTLAQPGQVKASDQPVPPLMAEFLDEPEDNDDLLELVDASQPVAPLTAPLEAVLLDDEPPMMAEFIDDEPEMLPEATQGPPSFEFIDPPQPAAEPAVLPPVPAFATPPWDDQPGLDNDEFDPLEQDEEAAEFTLSRSGPETIEELDLAAMVDVAFQLVLFFLVTATTVLYKSLEVPKPNNDAPPEAAVQGRGKSLDDMKANFILVEIDAAGTMKLDREPLPENITLDGLAERLRTARKDTDRTAMLLSADFATPHKNAVLAYDAANEIGLRIAIAKPTGAPAEGANAPPPPVRNAAF